MQIAQKIAVSIVQDASRIIVVVLLKCIRGEFTKNIDGGKSIMKKLFSMVLVVALAAVMVLGTAMAEEVVYSESNADGFTGTITALSGYTFTEENIELRLTISTADNEHHAWGFGCINDSAWANVTGLELLAAETAGESVMTLTLKEIGDAFAAFGSDPTAGVIINDWGDYGSVVKIEIVDTSATVEGGGGDVDDSVQTGDMTNIAILAGVAGLALVAVVASKKANA